jgi:hypothetical protein
MEKGQKGRGKDGKLGDRDKKGKDGFQDGGMGEVDALLRYTRNRRLHEALENELNKQGLGQWSECFREDERDRKQILNKGFKNHCKKILNVKQELLKLNSAVQQQGKKSDNRRATKESLIMILNRCQTHC